MYGVKLNLKPKHLTVNHQQRIVRLAKLGVNRFRISQICGIGVGSVEQVISSEPGLVEMRKRGRQESKRRSCRAQILRYRERHPEAMRRDIKSDCNTAFFWLYHNDRKWLEHALPTPMASLLDLGIVKSRSYSELIGNVNHWVL